MPHFTSGPQKYAREEWFPLHTGFVLGRIHCNADKMDGTVWKFGFRMGRFYRFMNMNLMYIFIFFQAKSQL
jgi:hypothetical protein